MRAFIIRPFGIKNEINFDEVEEKLISPALERLGITGRTTIEILKQGNIRVDMFQRLLTADLVVADLSIHNANVFYELGIRHALRDKRTFLIRCGGDSYPFDLQTDRYFNYDKENPGANVPKLVDALQQTVNSEDQDSPVFK
ncbi:MAG: tetratricopeptide repeat-containing protein, partial [Thermodesulfobacteriota bacterium]